MLISIVLALVATPLTGRFSALRQSSRTSRTSSRLRATKSATIVNKLTPETTANLNLDMNILFANGVSRGAATIKFQELYRSGECISKTGHVSFQNEFVEPNLGLTATLKQKDDSTVLIIFFKHELPSFTGRYFCEFGGIIENDVWMPTTDSTCIEEKVFDNSPTEYTIEDDFSGIKSITLQLTANKIN